MTSIPHPATHSAPSTASAERVEPLEPFDRHIKATRDLLVDHVSAALKVPIIDTPVPPPSVTARDLARADDALGRAVAAFDRSDPAAWGEHLSSARGILDGVARKLAQATTASALGSTEVARFLTEARRSLTLAVGHLTDVLWMQPDDDLDDLDEVHR